MCRMGVSGVSPSYGWLITRSWRTVTTQTGCLGYNPDPHYTDLKQIIVSKAPYLLPFTSRFYGVQELVNFKRKI